jgi:hypothetical protein
MPARGLGVYIPGCPPLAGFVRSGLALATKRPRGFLSARDMRVRNVGEILASGFDEGINYVVPGSPEPRAACQEVRRLLSEAQETTNKDWQAVVLSRNGLSTSRGLRFLERLSQEAALAGENKRKDWGERFQAGLDLAFLQAHESVRDQVAERLVRSMGFACGAILFPDRVSEPLLRALIEEHYGGLVLCKGNPDEIEKAYGDLYERSVEPSKKDHHV